MSEQAARQFSAVYVLIEMEVQNFIGFNRHLDSDSIDHSDWLFRCANEQALEQLIMMATPEVGVFLAIPFSFHSYAIPGESNC